MRLLGPRPWVRAAAKLATGVVLMAIGSELIRVIHAGRWLRQAACRAVMLLVRCGLWPQREAGGVRAWPRRYTAVGD